MVSPNDPSDTAAPASGGNTSGRSSHDSAPPTSAAHSNTNQHRKPTRSSSVKSHDSKAHTGSHADHRPHHNIGASTSSSTNTPWKPPAPSVPMPATAASTVGLGRHSFGHSPSHGQQLPFVKPSSYLRPKSTSQTHHGRGPIFQSRTMAERPLNPLDRDQLEGLRAIREFLKVRTSYDVLPLSFRLIVLDTSLLIKKSLGILIQNSIVSAPLWDSEKSKFAGLLTSTDYINVIQYYCHFPAEIGKLEQFRLSSLRDIERAIGVTPLETVSCHPMRPLYEALRQMLKTRARRIPLVDRDDETGHETVVSVITQYRILKFIAVNNSHNTVLLKKPIKDIGLGTYEKLATTKMTDTVLDAVHLMVKHNISCIPILDKHGRVLNVFEAVDIIPCIKGGAYEDLSATIGDALCLRSDDSPGIHTCSPEDRLDSIFDTLRKSRVHRLIVVDDESKLKGIISLSDILKYVLLYGEEDDGKTTWTTRLA